MLAASEDVDHVLALCSSALKTGHCGSVRNTLSPDVLRSLQRTQSCFSLQPFALDLSGHICGMLSCQILGRLYLSYFCHPLDEVSFRRVFLLSAFLVRFAIDCPRFVWFLRCSQQETGVVSGFCALFTACRRNCAPRVLPVPSVCFSRKGMGRINKGWVYLRGLQFSEAWSMPSWSWNSV